MPADPQPTTRGELVAQLERRVQNGAGADALVSPIQDFNRRAQQRADGERNRLDDRARFVQVERKRRLAEYFVQLEEQLAEAAGRDFDKEHPPIAVPELVGLDEAKTIAERVRAKKGRAA